MMWIQGKESSFEGKIYLQKPTFTFFILKFLFLEPVFEDMQNNRSYICTIDLLYSNKHGDQKTI
jgi:hypothetical protein